MIKTQSNGEKRRGKRREGEGKIRTSLPFCVSSKRDSSLVSSVPVSLCSSSSREKQLLRELLGFPLEE